MLFSPSFRHKNMATGMPHIYGENLAWFRIWCAMVYQQGFASMYTACIDMLILWWVEALQSLKHVYACRIHGETNVAWWHGSWQSYRDDHAHNIAWICTYDNRFEHIPILQGEELSWVEKVTHVAMRVHHAKCRITHTHRGIYIYIYIHIMHNATTQSGKVHQTLPISPLL